MYEEDSTDSAYDRYLLCKNNQFYNAYLKLSIKKKKKNQNSNSKFWVPVIVFLAKTAAKQPESHIITQG